MIHTFYLAPFSSLGICLVENWLEKSESETQSFMCLFFLQVHPGSMRHLGRGAVRRCAALRSSAAVAPIGGSGVGGWWEGGDPPYPWPLTLKGCCGHFTNWHAFFSKYGGQELCIHSHWAEKLFQMRACPMQQLFCIRFHRPVMVNECRDNGPLAMVATQFVFPALPRPRLVVRQHQEDLCLSPAGRAV